ncbi:MAG: GNAT family N-acetyltransferase, partial [Acidobacteriota bacterium]
DRLGEGHGFRIKQALITRARELGYHHLVARMMATNRGSIELNKRLGYELVGVQREIGFRNGEWCDATIMQLVL